MGTRHVEAHLDMVGHGRVLVDGHDISGLVQRITFDAQANEPTRIYIETPPHSADLIVDGEVLHKVTDGGPGSTVAFLQNVDAIALEAAAMELLQGLDGTIDSPTVAMLAVLQNWAQDGDDDRT